MEALEVDKKSEKERLTRLYHVVDWVDFGLIILVVLYFLNALARAMGFSHLFALINALRFDGELVNEWVYEMGHDVIMSMFEMSGILGILITLASLICCKLGVVLTVRLRKKGYIGRFRAIFRYIIWGVFIPLEAYFLVMMLVG